eukprot:4963528-Alexandrium_andersonii.AAC.1
MSLCSHELTAFPGVGTRSPLPMAVGHRCPTSRRPPPMAGVTSFAPRELLEVQSEVTGDYGGDPPF